MDQFEVRAFTPQPHWTEFVSALGPVLIACFIACIAYQQWVVNKATLREKLFERRFEVFKETQDFLTSIAQNAAVQDDTVPSFFDAVQRSRFLFGDEIHAHLDEIKSRAIKMRMYRLKLDGVPVGDERSSLVDLEGAELLWLAEQSSVNFDVFGSYLSFAKNK
ncbi:MAG: hypothetical protein AAFQ60_17815 [Pseudomonadota bacterium]